MLILMHEASTKAVQRMEKELEQIKARKMVEMLKRVHNRERPLTAQGPIALTDESFDSTIREHHLVMVDCWAAWCYPCRIIAPILDELANEYGAVALFAKLNVDDNPAIAMRYSIQSIPTILIIRNGIEVDRIVGAVPKVDIEAVLKKHL